MARGSEASPASTPTSFSSAIDSDAAAIDATAPVPTPATSICEHSMPTETGKSHNDGGNETKGSRRVTRSSLKQAELKGTDDDIDENTALDDETIANDKEFRVISGREPKKQGFRSVSPRPGLANMEAGDAGLPANEDVDDDNAHGIADSASLSSELEGADVSTELRSLNLDDNTTTKGEDGAKRKKSQTDNTKSMSSRRSTRLSLLDKTKELAQTAPSALGKRPFDTISQGKEKSKTLARRASLRPRVESQKDKVSSLAVQAPPAKKRRVSEGDESVSRTATQPEPPKRENSLIRQMKKSWLKHGLYAGQDYVDQTVPKPKKGKGKAKNEESQQGKVFPLPMYAGARLLENGRDYKLPFDIFSPLPHGQPKPNEWRKANKSTY